MTASDLVRVSERESIFVRLKRDYIRSIYDSRNLLRHTSEYGVYRDGTQVQESLAFSCWSIVTCLEVCWPLLAE